MDAADLPEGFEHWPRRNPEAVPGGIPRPVLPEAPLVAEAGDRRGRQRAEAQAASARSPAARLPDNRGYRCGCSHGIPNCPDCPPCRGNPDWSIWLNLTGRGCVAGHTLIYLPLEDRHERIDVLAADG